MKRKTAYALGPLSLLALAGCQLFPTNLAHNRSVARPAEPDMTSYFAQRLEEGRAHLRAGRAGAAITAFRQASYLPEFAPDALNGLAVAYDSIGREDLAERYFLAAIDLAPDNDAFSRNLARFQARTGGPVQELEPMLADTSPVEEAVSRMNFAVTSVHVDDDDFHGVERVSDREVRIRSRGHAASRLSNVAAERPAIVHLASRETTIAAPPNEPPEYPVRVDIQHSLAAQDSAGGRTFRVGRQAGPPNGRGYPVRVVLPSS